MATASTLVTAVDGHRLRLSNLDKVLYPDDGFTKGEVLDYYARIADVLLPHLADRAVTRKRWPEGTDAAPFFEKNLPRGTPGWVRTVRLDSPGSSKNRDEIVYPLIDDRAGLVWCANLAALELHVPQWRVSRRGAVRPPDRLVVDLDPGPPAGLDECVQVALAVRDRLARDGLDALPVTSGSKGLQLYAAISGRQPADTVKAYARRIAEELERAMPALVVSRMDKARRTGKVLIDWSQNDGAKTTVVPYSLRGRARPTAAAPHTVAELEAGQARQRLAREVLERVQADGDLLAPLFTAGPRVPTR
jgi:bifunctional non-homologous end joining protein LigD